jgi:hypothetical protein
MPVAGTPDSTPPSETDAIATATGFATAWAQPGLPAEQWAAGILPWCTPRFGAILRHVSPARIPARHVTGQPKLIHRQPGSLTYAVPTDAGTLAVGVINHDGQWKVHSREFTSDTGATAPLVKPTR